MSTFIQVAALSQSLACALLANKQLSIKNTQLENEKRQLSDEKRELSERLQVTLIENHNLTEREKQRIKNKTIVKRRILKSHLKDSEKKHLEEVFRLDKYPDLKQRKKLSEELNLSVKRITNWFANRRRGKKATTEAASTSAAAAHVSTKNINNFSVINLI
uniref:Homeobox domain-containing protein n=1 Tax=Meloidogyne hapla TaxID=6305 RepID=A0A1I8C3N9_MELHA